MARQPETPRPPGPPASLGRSPTASTPLIGARRGVGDDRLDRDVFVVEPHGDGAVAPGIVQLVTSVGGEHQLDAQPLGGFVERAQLITGRRGEEKDSASLWILDC